MDVGSDARDGQIGILLFLAAFLLSEGKELLSGSDAVFFPLLLAGILYFGRKEKGKWKSPLITCLSVLILLDSTSLFFPFKAFLCMLALFSKQTFIVQRGNKDRHIFNPSNFAIVISLLFYSSVVWISPAKWNIGGAYQFTFLILGLGVAFWAGRLSVGLSYALGYAFLYILRGLILGDPFEVTFHALTQNALVLFALLMMTDPATTPQRPLEQMSFAFLAAFSTFILETQWFVRNAPFYGLFLSSFLFMGILPKYQGMKWLYFRPRRAS